MQKKQFPCMGNLIHYTACPVCGSQQIREVLSVRDHSVTRQAFPISECASCTLRFTQDLPDAASIAPYYQFEDYISHTNTRKGLVNRLYHLVRKRTLQSKRKLIQQITGKSTGALLDIGAGTGAFLHTMRQAGWEATGLEPDAGARKLAKNDFGIELGEPGELFSLPEKSFDAITLWHVLEHVHELQRYVSKCRQLLKPGGRLVIAVPNYTSADAAHYGPFWAAYDVPRHLYHFSPAAMRQLMGVNGMKIAKTLPMWFDSFYVAMLSEKYKSGKTNLPLAAWNGLRSNLKAWGNKERCSSVIYVAVEGGNQ